MEDTKEGGNLEQSTGGETETEKARKMLQELSQLGLNDVEKVAEGVRAFVDFQEQILNRYGEGLTADERTRYTREVIDFVVKAKGPSTPGEVWEQRSASGWTPDQMKQFNTSLQEIGVIPPSSSASTPPVGK